MTVIYLLKVNFAIILFLAGVEIGPWRQEMKAKSHHNELMANSQAAFQM